LFGLDPKSVAVGAALGLLVLPRIIAPLTAKLSKGTAK
jgi:hypothetical protein